MVSPPMEEPGQLKRAMIDSTAGAIAGCVSRTVTSPLDVIKIRFQVDFGSICCICLISRKSRREKNDMF